MKSYYLLLGVAIVIGSLGAWNAYRGAIGWAIADWLVAVLNLSSFMIINNQSK